MPLGARITVGHIKLVAGLAGLPVEEAAQTIKVRFGHAEKRRGVLRPGADQADEPGWDIFARRGDGRGARLSGSFRRRGLGAGGERQSERGGEDAATMSRHAAGSTISGLSSPSRGASLANGGRVPSNDSGSPTSEIAPDCWMMPSAAVCASATTWSTV